MRHLRRLSALTTLSLFLAVLTSVSVAAPASADHPTLHNRATMWLTDDPYDWMQTACTPSKRVYLTQGTYHWGEYLDGRSTIMKRMWLNSGWYGWMDCLDPKNGGYRHTSYLDPERSGWSTVSYAQESTFIHQSGNHTWGSYLDPQF